MKKRRLKEVLYGFEIRITGIIANGLVNKNPKAVIFRLMKKELARTGKYLQLDAVEINKMWLQSVKLYNDVKKNTVKSDDKESVYAAVRKNIAVLEKNKNEIANSVEYKVKLEEKRDILSSNNVFYVCNWFDDCAKDHIPYQGRVYVQDNWKEMTDENMHGKIERYIKNHNTLGLREIMDNAPWLGTRRNCRHKFYPVPVDEVLSSSVNSILKRRDLRHKHENEYNCVLTPERATYIGYYERLKALTYLKKLFDCEKLDADIKETRKLVNKWSRAVSKKK